MTRTLAQLVTATNPGAIDKQIEVAGLTGLLVGVIPVADRVQLALIVGGAHRFTDALPLATTYTTKD